MRIKRTLEPLYDWFDDATVTRIDDETYDVRIMGNELATFWWTLQYADTRLIEILSPQSLRVRLHDVGRISSSSTRKRRRNAPNGRNLLELDLLTNSVCRSCDYLADSSCPRSSFSLFSILSMALYNWFLIY